MPRIRWTPLRSVDTFDASALTGNKGDVFSDSQREIVVSDEVAERLLTYPGENFRRVRDETPPAADVALAVAIADEKPSDAARRANRG
jgi:hypothetical protein